ncbi:MAG: NUDIX domain-containing protein [Candidatus Paceibacterota bacterium]|jgi:ADP-ribose pyrophosphatase YjhB (NUDIX family)|nr:NUDIX domain-containing protein [Candidatus Paceibacterota bacterium]
MKSIIESGGMAMIEVIARAVIIDQKAEKVLFCAPISKSYYYLPGGHVEAGEGAVAALRRELREEMGKDISDEKFSFAGAGENFFIQEGKSHHEVNLYFRADNVFSASKQIDPQEDHIVFQWIALSTLDEFPILPKEIIPMIKTWAEDNSVLWND